MVDRECRVEKAPGAMLEILLSYSDSRRTELKPVNVLLSMQLIWLLRSILETHDIDMISEWSLCACFVWIERCWNTIQPCCLNFSFITPGSYFIIWEYQVETVNTDKDTEKIKEHKLYWHKMIKQRAGLNSNQAPEDGCDNACSITLAFDMKSCETMLTELVSISNLWDGVT